MSRKIYLDYAASTPDRSLPISLVDMDYWGGYGNSHSIHQKGLEAAKTIERAKRVILDFINGHDGQLLWTSSGTHANEIAIRSMCESHTLLTTEIEHKSIMQHCDTFAHTKVTPDKFGTVTQESIIRHVGHGTDMVSIHMVNNITGIVQPLRGLKANLPKNTYLHTDAVQALGKIPIDVNHLRIDLMTMSSHKIYGPKGLGILWVRNEAFDDDRALFPYLGTEPTELICRFANTLAGMEIQEYADWVAVLEQEFFKCLRNLHVEFERVTGFNRIAGLFSLRFPDVDSDELVFALSERGVYISTGSACDNGKVEPSHVLTAMGIQHNVASEIVRISIGHTTTMEEVQEAASIIASTIEELKNGS